MIGLVESYGDICMLSDIKAVQHMESAAGRASRYLLRLHSGGELTLFDHDYADLRGRPVQLMPATPGTRLLTVFGGLASDELPFVDTAPIFAWALCMDGQIRPVTPVGVSRGYRPTDKCDWYPEYVETPDGAIHQYGYDAEPEDFGSVEAVIERETRRQRAYEAERAKRAVRGIADAADTPA